MLTVESDLYMHEKFRNYCYVYKLYTEKRNEPEISMVRLPDIADKDSLATCTHISTSCVCQCKRKKKTLVKF